MPRSIKRSGICKQVAGYSKITPPDLSKSQSLAAMNQDFPSTARRTCWEDRSRTTRTPCQMTKEVGSDLSSLQNINKSCNNLALQRKLDHGTLGQILRIRISLQLMLHPALFGSSRNGQQRALVPYFLWRWEKIGYEAEVWRAGYHGKWRKK